MSPEFGVVINDKVTLSGEMEEDVVGIGFEIRLTEKGVY